MSEPERGPTKKAVEILGLPVSTILKLAQRGVLPGAARLGHSTIAVTEGYLKYVTTAVERAAKYGRGK